jgi:hypothetical protein
MMPEMNKKMDTVKETIAPTESIEANIEKTDEKSLEIAKYKFQVESQEILKKLEQTMKELEIYKWLLRVFFYFSTWWFNTWISEIPRIS